MRGGLVGFEGKLSKLLNRQTQPSCLLIEKRACPGCTEGVHGEVADLEVTVLLLDEDQLRILAAEIDDRLDLGIEMLNRLGLGDDLVDEISSQKL